MCEKKFIYIEYTRTYSYAKFGTLFSATLCIFSFVHEEQIYAKHVKCVLLFDALQSVYDTMCLSFVCLSMANRCIVAKW